MSGRLEDLDTVTLMRRMPCEDKGRERSDAAEDKECKDCSQTSRIKEKLGAASPSQHEGTQQPQWAFPFVLLCGSPCLPACLPAPLVCFYVLAASSHQKVRSTRTPGVGDGQGGLACCSPWGHKESEVSERLNCTVFEKFAYMLNTVYPIIIW